MTGAPLLFLDVDGPLIPFGLAPDRYPHHGPDADTGNPLLARLDPAHGPRLAGLGCELVWATTWAHDANECVAPRLGLPPLPVLDWDPAPDEPGGQHWKTRDIVRWAAGRPFAWVDDEITDADRSFVATRHPGPALPHRVDPAHGLTDADYAALRRWLATV